MTSKPYLLVSDIHAHKWSQFSTVNADGVNSRLRLILDELLRAAKELLARGGNRMFIAGDIFHVRGSVDPEVFNPVFDTFVQIAEMGIHVCAIPGNHDLVGRDTTKLGNAFQTLDNIANFSVITKLDVPWAGHPPYVMMVPWQASKAQLREVIGNFKSHSSIPGRKRSEIDLILHVGIDGMLDDVPDSGLSAKEVASWGFKRVFAGDYHNYREAEDGKVISIGATTHQQWGDIGAKAGFLLVYPDHVEFCASHAPSFIEITGEDDPEEIPLLVDGNYVRVRGMKLTDSELKTMRDELTEMGARGVTFQVTREVVAARSGSPLAKATTLDQSVDKFVDTMTFDDPDDIALVKAGAADVLATTRSIAI